MPSSRLGLCAAALPCLPLSRLQPVQRRLIKAMIEQDRYWVPTLELGKNVGQGQTHSGREIGLAPAVCLTRLVVMSAYLALLRVTTSNTTAKTSTAPRTTYWRAMSVPMRFMPLVNDI